MARCTTSQALISSCTVTSQALIFRWEFDNHHCHSLGNALILPQPGLIEDSEGKIHYWIGTHILTTKMAPCGCVPDQLNSTTM